MRAARPTSRNRIDIAISIAIDFCHGPRGICPVGGSPGRPLSFKLCALSRTPRGSYVSGPTAVRRPARRHLRTARETIRWRSPSTLWPARAPRAPGPAGSGWRLGASAATGSHWHGGTGSESDTGTGSQPWAAGGGDASRRPRGTASRSAAAGGRRVVTSGSSGFGGAVRRAHVINMSVRQ